MRSMISTYMQSLRSISWIYLLMLLGTGLTQAQTVSTMPFMIFDNPLEESLFKANLQADDWAICLMPGKSVTKEKLGLWQSQLEKEVESLRKGFGKCNTGAAKLKYLDEKLKGKYFKWFSPFGNLGHLLEEGKYNSLSATLFMSFVLDKLGQPYRIVAFPESYFIKILDQAEPSYWQVGPLPDMPALPNSTKLGQPLRVLEVEEIMDFSGMSEAEACAKLLPEWEGERELSRRQLMAAHYTQGIWNFNKEMTERWVLSSQMKSTLLFPSPEANMLKATLAIWFSSPPRREIDRLWAMAVLLQKLPEEFDREAIWQHCLRVPGELHHAKLAPLQLYSVESIRNFMSAQPLYDSIMVAGKLAAEAEDFFEFEKDTLKGLDRLYLLTKYMPGDYIERYADARIRFIWLHNSYEEIDSMLQDLFNEFPRLNDSEWFWEAKLFSKLNAGNEAFDKEDFSKGETYFLALESDFRPTSSERILYYVGLSYSRTVKKFVRQKNYDKARRYLLKGLELAPDSEDILQTKSTFGKELGVK